MSRQGFMLGHVMIVITSTLAFMLALITSVSLSPGGEPIYHAELIFPLAKSHNHASSLAELPNGDLLVAWYRGSGEHEADDVKIMGARKAHGHQSWSEPFVMADTANFPDANPIIFIDREKQLQMIWSMIIANDWRTSFLKSYVSKDYQRQNRAPVWQIGEPLIFDFKDFASQISTEISKYAQKNPIRANAARLALLKKSAGDKLTSRMGWIARARPLVLPTGRILLPLYSDALSVSMMAISDDGGKKWSSGKPIVGLGNIQPTIARRNNGTLVSYMRNAGPPPKRLYRSVSSDDGMTWSLATHTELPNPGSAAELLRLVNGYWALVYNDSDVGRHRLAVSISADEGKSWSWKRYLEQDQRRHGAGQFHYPSIVQSRDGVLHVTYSYFLNHLSSDAPNKAIKHATFNLEWIKAGGA